MVHELSDRLDLLDFQRIERGLKISRDELSKVEPAQRSQKVLMETDQTALLAVYEALCCVPFHKNDESLAIDFDFVFESIQTRKILRIGDTLPAMARFLFSSNTCRKRFAEHAWTKMTDMLSPQLFEWVVHDMLRNAMCQAAYPSTSSEDVYSFWHAFKFMLEKMDSTLIRHSLRSMEAQPDIYRLALQHLACRLGGELMEATTEILQTMQQLLLKAPKDFWLAMGTISPATVADQVFQSPGFKMLLNQQEAFTNSDEPPAVTWIGDFIDSVPADGKYEACRKLLDFLLVTAPGNNYPQDSQIGCCRAALKALHSTLATFNSPEFKINPSISLIVISNVMELVYTHRATIMQCADLPRATKAQEDLKTLGVQVIKDALTLDCKAIGSEHAALDSGTPIQRGNRGETQKLWESVLDIFRPGNVQLAMSILPATNTLIGLDELLPTHKKYADKLPKDHVQFNTDYRQLMDNLAKVFQRLSDFDPRDLSQLCSSSATARPLFGALISSDEGVHEATLEIVKATTGQDSKRDAIQSLLETMLSPFLNSITAAVMRVGSKQIFGAVPHMVKVNREILKGLCGNTGVLRTKESFDTQEKNSIIGWWTSQWKSLDSMFINIEAWAPRVNKPTVYMQDFLRDCMEYAEALFNEYTIFASVLNKVVVVGEDNTNVSSSASIKTMLYTVCNNVFGLVGMLRLRDGYLISVITSLMGKLLRSLGEYNLEVDERTSNFIKDACKRDTDRGSKKTNLTSQQKAELQRALEENQGVEIIETPKQTFFKQQGIDAWSRSADGKQHEPKLPSKSSTHETTLSSDRLKSTLGRTKVPQPMSGQSRDAFMENRRKVEEERKRNNIEAIARAKALRAPASTVKGEGSGLKDIGGVAGKDHAPIRNEIMVGSSDEDSDDDEMDETDALVKTGREKSKQVAEYDRLRQLQMQASVGPVKKTKIQRSAKDLRARVEPNMDRLYLEILNWDIFHLEDTPPSNNECRKIDNKYLDLDLYKSTFTPLLIMEVWRSLATARDENNFKAIETKVLNRLSVDKFMEVSTTMPMSNNRDLKMSERDIVLLGKSPDPMKNPREPHCLARVDRTTRKRDMIEVTYRVSRDVHPSFLSSLVPNGKIFAVKIADMTTTQREYAALSSLEYYDLCNEVLEAKPSPIQKYSDDKINSISAKYSLNKGQAQAILSAKDNDGFTLIQG